MKSVLAAGWGSCDRAVTWIRLLPPALRALRHRSDSPQEMGSVWGKASPPYTSPQVSPGSCTIHSLFLMEEGEADIRNRAGNPRVTQALQSEPMVTYSRRIWKGLKLSPGSSHTIQFPHLTHNADTGEEIRLKRRQQKLVRFLFQKGNSLFLGDYYEIQQVSRT